jgi:putative tryptophan/tyrosine transport system substrate-binding protein
MLSPELGDGHEAARFHHASRRRGCCVADCCGCAAADDASVGFLNSAAGEPFAYLVAAYRQGLKEIGYVEGQNVTIDYRWAEGHYDRLPALAADLVRGRAAVIAATGSAPSALAAKVATTTIPIVFVASEPLRLGLVNSLSRPDGNITGISSLGFELEEKRLEILSQVLSPAAIIAALTNPNSPNRERQLKNIQAAARTLGRQIIILKASNEPDIDAAFAAGAQRHIGGLNVASDPFLGNRRDQLVALAARYAIPTMYPGETAAPPVGGLMGYGADLSDAYRLAGVYTGRILKGEKPADLPVIQATKVQLIINLKTAKALGLEIPPSLLARADEMIE